MKVRSFLVIVPLILVFAFIWASNGCSKSDSSSAQDMMQHIPEGISSFAYVDLKAMHGDSDLEDIYQDIREGYTAESAMYQIDFDDVNYLADCGGKKLVIFSGEFDLADIRNALEGNDYTAVGYNEEEAWLNSSEATMVALFEDTVAIGDKADVEEYIMVIKGEATPLLDSEDALDVVDKLRGGIAIYFSDTAVFGSEAFGTSYKKKDGDTMTITNAFKFGDTDEAEAAKDGVAEMFKATTDYKDINVKRDGELIIITGQLAIADMVQ